MARIRPRSSLRAWSCQRPWSRRPTSSGSGSRAWPSASRAFPEREPGGGRAARLQGQDRAGFGGDDVAAGSAIGEELATARGHHGSEFARGVGLRVVDENGLALDLATVRRGVRGGRERAPSDRPARLGIDRLQFDHRPERDRDLAVWSPSTVRGYSTGR